MYISQKAREAYRFGSLDFHEKARTILAAPREQKDWYILLMQSQPGGITDMYETSKPDVRQEIIRSLRLRPAHAGMLIWDSSLESSEKRAIIDQASKCYNKVQYAEFVHYTSEGDKKDKFFRYAWGKAKDQRSISKFKPWAHWVIVAV